MAISPEGRYVATGTWTDRGVKVWEVATRQLIQEFPAQTGAQVAFSPDGRWLAVSSDTNTLYEVGTWKPRHRLPFRHQGYITFSPDSAIFALGGDPQKYYLFATETGERLATLELPQPVMGDWMRFSPDGTTLATFLNNWSIQLWDLRRLRRQLATMNLDWNLPPYPPAAASSPAPVRVEVRTE